MSLKQNYFIYYFLPVIILLVTALPAFSQKLIPDTVYVDLKSDSIIELSRVGIGEIADLRNEHPNFIGFTSKKRYLLIPVDREIHASDSIVNFITQNIPHSSADGREYKLEVDKFEVIEKKSKFSTSIILVADIRILEMKKDTLIRIGTLYYDYPYYRKSRKESSDESTQKLLYDWHTDFKLDLLTLETVHSGMGSELAPNFISDIKVSPLYLNARAGAFIGLNWHGFQGEVFFNRPETKLEDRYSAGIVRYINRPEYESFAIGRKASHRFWRKSENWLLDIDANVLMGFCKWKNIEENDPTLYQLFDFEISSIQSIVFYPLNRNSITFRAGLIENLSYVIEKSPTFEIGLYTEIGFKF